jgi:Asp-tRNA(Asn)/Glu-tRNA(Gln) amidotransferase C subunit
MIADLESQLQFVRAIEEVDTEGVEPLRAIRDETRDAEREGEIGMEELKGEFEKEEVVGKRGRIRGRVEEGVNAPEEVVEGRWDPLGQAPKKMGRFIVVETGKG